MNMENTRTLSAMRQTTPARVGIGRSGPRLTTAALLALQADYAKARDSVTRNVDEAFLKRMGLPVLSSICTDREDHLRRPDHGWELSASSERFLKEQCVQNPQIQVYISDGLSSESVEHNIPELLPVLMSGLSARGISTGTLFFVKYGRVPTMDRVSALTHAELTCVLIGERPGLAASDSMSAYITYGAYPGIPECSRTVVSNIHKNGLPPKEAGAYLADLLPELLETKMTGVARTTAAAAVVPEL